MRAPLVDGSLCLAIACSASVRFGVRVASRNFVTNCLISDVTGKLFCIPLPI